MIVDLVRFVEAERPHWTALEQFLKRLDDNPGADLHIDEAQRPHDLYQRTSSALGHFGAMASEPELRGSHWTALEQLKRLDDNPGADLCLPASSALSRAGAISSQPELSGHSAETESLHWTAREEFPKRFDLNQRASSALGRVGEMMSEPKLRGYLA
jgi:hypothetical protein